MNKEEIKHFKSLLRQGSVRHMNILLNDKFQKELQTIIKNYEKLQRENKKQKEVIDKAVEFLYKIKFDKTDKYICISEYIEYQQLLDILKEVSK